MITIATLEKIVNISELSTYTAVYEGVAEIYNEKKTDKIDYYVAYKAKINAGVDLEKVSISIKDKVITIDIPEIYITGTSVDMKSLEFLFYNEKADDSAVTEVAYKACETDVTEECEKLTAIHELAEQNAKNVLSALIKPFLQQVDESYALIIE